MQPKTLSRKVAGYIAAGYAAVSIVFGLAVCRPLGTQFPAAIIIMGIIIPPATATLYAAIRMIAGK
jgi:hypothetical protein